MEFLLDWCVEIYFSPKKIFQDYSIVIINLIENNKLKVKFHSF